MAQKIPKNFKNCAVCEYWAGPRELDNSGNSVIVSSTNIKGKCLLKDSGWYKREKPANTRCPKWQPWSALK